MRYSFRQLEVFLAAARSENLSRAAERLAMSQSAASGALRDLEQHLDIRLFDRAGKRLKPNELGRALQPHAEALLQQATALERSFDQRAAIGRLKVGATLTIGNSLAVELLAQYLGLYPEARVDLEVANTARIAAQVANFELDLGLIEGELASPDLDVTPWREDELVVCCALPATLWPASGRSVTGNWWRPAGSCVNPAPAPARPSIAPCAACSANWTSAWSCATRRRYSGRWLRGSDLDACRV